MRSRPRFDLHVVTARGPGGATRSHNMTAHIGTPTYGERMVVIRSILPAGWTLDSTDADAAHARLCAARERYDDAYRWWQQDTLGRPHPGTLAEYMES